MIMDVKPHLVVGPLRDTTTTIGLVRHPRDATVLRKRQCLAIFSMFTMVGQCPTTSG